MSSTDSYTCRHLFVAAFLTVCCSSALGSTTSCGLYLRPGEIGHSTHENRIERNGALHGVSGSTLVDVRFSGLRGSLSIPAATALTTHIASLFPSGTLKPHSVTEIFIVDSLARVESIAESLSSRVRRRSEAGLIVDFDENDDFFRVYVESELFDPDFTLKTKLPLSAFAAVPVNGEKFTLVKHLKRRKLKPLIRGADRDGSVFVGGLISISAEPPEGFFAAATAAELARGGWKVKNAAEAEVWIYRVPDSRPESYFDFTFSSPDRPAPEEFSKKFKIATGIGPSTHPESLGGRDADLLWLGDEQKGPLERYLKKIARKTLELEDLYAERGIVQRLDHQRVVLAGIDHRYALTQEGFDAMETDPTLYRRVFDVEYDRFLLSLFKDSHPNVTNRSFLLATSRGCSQGCAICCSGGLSQFQYFSAERMVNELAKIVQHSSLKAGERINLFLIDSNFNNNPGRIIDFAKLYQASSFKNQFDFFIRHNTVNGFLKSGPGGVKIPNEELIAAYSSLGVKEIFMGVDSFDDASTITLKTHKFKVAKEGAEARPIYSVGETTALISALDRHGMYSKGFFLTNNPWVSDLDRIDSYYNLLEIWLDFPRFSIDSARDRNVIRLKPFDGSPIGETAKLMGGSVVKNGRFFTQSPIGELDEMMDFVGLGRPRIDSSTDATIMEFWNGIRKIQKKAENLRFSPNGKTRAYATAVLSKLSDRNLKLRPHLPNSNGCPSCSVVALEMNAQMKRLSNIPAFDPRIQKQMFEENIQSLEDGLKRTNPKKGAAI